MNKNCISSHLLQVTKKQTPQKNRKGSVSDEGLTQTGEDHSPRESKPDTVLENTSKCDNLNVVNTNSEQTDTYQGKQVLATDNKVSLSEIKSSPLPEASREATPSKEKSPAPQPGSGKKTKRRIAANFNMSN